MLRVSDRGEEVLAHPESAHGVVVVGVVSPRPHDVTLASWASWPARGTRATRGGRTATPGEFIIRGYIDTDTL